MLDIKFVRENPEAVKENIRKKFQYQKLPLVDEAVALDAQLRAVKTEANDLRANRNALSKRVGMASISKAQRVRADVFQTAAQCFSGKRFSLYRRAFWPSNQRPTAANTGSRRAQSLSVSAVNVPLGSQA